MIKLVTGTDFIDKLFHVLFRKIKKVALWLLVILIAAVVFFIVVYRPWSLNWGATDADIKRSMPGDELLTNPSFNATRGVTIKAQPEEIWPWIVQIGYKRAGLYSYDKLDNAGIPSAEHIIPEYQNLKVGDKVPLGEGFNVEVTELTPNQSMLLVFPDNIGPFSNTTWAWELYRKDAQHTRMLTRLRVDLDSITARTWMELFEIFMMRKCMLNIKRRAESMAASD